MAGLPALGRNYNPALRVLLSCACFSSKLMQNADKKLGPSQAEGMRQPLSQRERFIASLESLVWVAELLQSKGYECQAIHPGIDPAIKEGERPMAPRIIHQLGRALDVGEQRRHRLALAIQTLRRLPLMSDFDAWSF